MRLSYNFGLAIAGVLAFICYGISMELFASPYDMSAEITVFTVVAQGVGYLVAMLVANLLYFLGPLAEVIIQPTDVMRFRKIAYRLGFWFSVVLPFSLPILATIHFIQTADSHMPPMLP